DAVRVDDTGTLLHGLQKRLIGFDLLGDNHDVLWRTIGTAAHLQYHLLLLFAREGADRLVGSAVGGQEFITHLEARVRGGEAIEHPANKGFVANTPGEDADARIGHLPTWKDPS